MGGFFSEIGRIISAVNSQRDEERMLRAQAEYARGHGADIPLGTIGDNTWVMPVFGQHFTKADVLIGQPEMTRSLLQSAARNALIAGFPVSVISAQPETWEGTVGKYDIFDSRSSAAEDHILSVASDASQSRGAHLLVVDDFSVIGTLDFDAKQNFRWLMLKGNPHGVGIIGSCRAENAYDALQLYEEVIEPVKL